MKKAFLIFIFISVLSFFSCGPSAEEIAAKEKAIQDSIYAVVAAQAAQAEIDGTLQSSNLETVEIGTQTWTTQNLNVSYFRNGEPIPEARTNEEWKEAARTHKPAFCYYNNSQATIQQGKLYNWYAVIDKRGLAPEGYHVPNRDEWFTLFKYFGRDQFNSTNRSAGYEMKSKNGFNAIPAGIRYEQGSFNLMNEEAHWWTFSNNYEESKPYHHHAGIEYRTGFTYLPGASTFDAGVGMSVRCIKGESTEKMLEIKSIDENEYGELIEFDENGNPREGIWYTYHPDKTLKTSKTYKNGYEDGEWIEYGSYGFVTCKGNAKNGLKEGEWIFYEDKYSDMKFITARGYFIKGKKEGEWLEYEIITDRLSRSSELSCKENYKNGLLDGKREVYGDYGRIESYKEGTPHGEWIEYFAGFVHSKKIYVNGKIEGDIIEYNGNGDGKIHHRMVVENGEVIKHIFYDSEGNILKD